MIGGIFETIGKKLGIGKEKYFLELDDAAEGIASKVQKAASSAVDTVKDVSSDVADTIQSKADDVGSAANKAKANAQKKAAKAADKAENAADTAASKADKEAAKFNKKANKLIKEGDAKVKVAANEKTGQIEATAIETDKGKKPSNKSAKQIVANKPDASEDAGSGASESKTFRDPEDIIREALAKSQKAPDGRPSDPTAAETFSTDYLMPLSSSRRRPGPSLSKYKSMARETNPRLKS